VRVDGRARVVVHPRVVPVIAERGGFLRMRGKVGLKEARGEFLELLIRTAVRATVAGDEQGQKKCGDDSETTLHDMSVAENTVLKGTGIPRRTANGSAAASASRVPGIKDMREGIISECE